MLTLSHFLRTQVKEEEFNMKSFIGRTPAVANKLLKHNCGTTACAIGYCPAVFPRHWTFGFNDSNCSIPHLRKTGSPNVYDDSIEFFGITVEEHRHLFSIHKRTPTQEADAIDAVVDSYGWELKP